MDKELNKLTTEWESAVEEVTKTYAFKFLEHYRQLVKRHNYSRHKITIVAGMGVQSVLVDGKFLFDRPNWEN